MQFFIDSEIAKKEEKDRIIHDRQVSSVMAAKKTKSWDDELRDDTKITESAGEFLSLYFLREKVVMEKVRTCTRFWFWPCCYKNGQIKTLQR